MKEKKQFWQTEVGRIILLTVAILLAGFVYDFYWRSNWGPYFSNEEAVRWSIKTNEQIDCMAGVLGNYDKAALRNLSKADRISLGTEIRQRCENIDCVAKADTNSQKVYSRPLSEWDDTTRTQVLLEWCWRRGVPLYWRKVTDRD